MPLVSAGPAVWNEFDKFRKATKRTQKAEHLEWSLSSGWRVQPEDEWDKQPKKPKTKRVRLYTGRYVEVPDSDYDDYIGHMVSPPSDPDSEIGRYIDEANWTQEFETGGGHIARVQYAPTRQLLDVLFRRSENSSGGRDGDEVVFFRVPKEVYSELAYLSEGDKTIIDAQGKARHLIGIRFWDVVRIRGTQTGARYRFEYLQQGQKTSTKSISRDMIEAMNEGGAGGTTKEEKQSKAKADMEDTLNRIARGFLGESAKQEYNSLGSYEEKAAFMKKRGFI